MAGANVTLDDAQLQRLFKDLIKQGSDLEPVFRDIGEHLLISHPERFEQQVSPDGDLWEPLAPKTKARKKRNKSKILIESGDLMEMLSYDADSDELLFGTNKIYGATHQFGDEDRNIPAREWLGLSDDDVDVITDIVRRHLIES